MINKEEIFKTLFRPGCLVWGWKNMPCFEAWLHYCHVHLPFCLHLLDEGAVIQGLQCLTFRLHRLDKGAVWSGSTLFAIPFASFGWRSSLIRVYTVRHSVCIFWMKGQSDQGLHCLPFHLHHLDEGAVWSGSTLFAIPFALFGWRSSLIRVYTAIPLASFG